MNLVSLPAPTYSREEREKIIDYVVQLTKEEILQFLRDHKLRTSGTKEKLKKRLEQALKSQAISLENLVQLIDTIEPWGKQHLYLYAGPEGLLQKWRDSNYVESQLKEHRVHKYLNSRLPLILPSKLTLSSVEHSPDVLRITAIERRDAWERDEKLDETRVDDGRSIRLRAFAHEISRGIVRFEWNLSTNHAMLQITQLPSRSKYEDARQRFAALTEKWLSLSHFPPLDLGRIIKRLHIASKDKSNCIRSHWIGFTSLAGRKLVGRSASTDTSLVGEPAIDDALDGMNQHGTGHEGNFFFLSGGDDSNPIPNTAEVHVILLADKGRINFTASNSEEVLRHVLGRIRNASN